MHPSRRNLTPIIDPTLNIVPVPAGTVDIFGKNFFSVLQPANASDSPKYLGIHLT